MDLIVVLSLGDRLILGLDIRSSFCVVELRASSQKSKVAFFSPG